MNRQLLCVPWSRLRPFGLLPLLGVYAVLYTLLTIVTEPGCSFLSSKGHTVTVVALGIGTLGLRLALLFVLPAWVATQIGLGLVNLAHRAMENREP